jgi:hypothetical protein
MGAFTAYRYSTLMRNFISISTKFSSRKFLRLSLSPLSRIAHGITLPGSNYSIHLFLSNDNELQYLRDWLWRAGADLVMRTWTFFPGSICQA